MKIAIDLQCCQSGSRYGGIGRYSIELAKAMVRRGSDHSFVIVISDANPEGAAYVRAAFVDLLPPDAIRTFTIPKKVSELTNPASKVRAAELIREQFFAELQPDIVHLTSLFEGLLEDNITSVGQVFAASRTAVTLYDLIPLAQRERYLCDPLAAKHYLAKVEHLRRAGCLLAISDFSRLEACELLSIDPAHVVNISSAADSRFRPIPLAANIAKALREKYEIEKRFLMYTSSFDQRKNQAALIGAFGLLPASIRSEYQLVIVGNGWEAMYEQLRLVAQESGLAKNDLVFAGHVSDADLLPLYNLCDLFVFPSLAEGFGLPVLEAMSCGVPTVCSNTTSLPEVIGMEAATFNPTSAKSIAKAIERGLTDTNFRQALRAHGLERAKLFSWDESARRAIEAFETMHRSLEIERYAVVATDDDQALAPLLNRFKAIPGIEKMPDAGLRDFSRCLAVNSLELKNAQSVDRGEKATARVGWISTWNKRCGIASYSRFLLNHWPSPVSIFAQYADWTTQADEPNVIRCWDADGSDDLAFLGQCVLRETLDVVVIQFNYGFFNFAALNRLLTQLVDAQLKVFVTFHSTQDTLAPLKNLTELTTSLQRCAGLIAHTLRDVAALAKADLHSNVTLLPQGVIDTAPPQRVALEKSIKTIATYGFALPNKGLSQMVEAMKLMCQGENAGVRLLMVNAEYPDPQSATTLSALRQAISKMGLEDSVVLATSYLSDDESIALLQQADLVVFAYQNTGESSSAAVRMGLASGTPVAVTPLHIFDDVSGCAFTLPGVTAEDLAVGITQVLKELETSSPNAKLKKQNTERWRKSHSFSKISKELFLLTARPVQTQDEYDINPDYALSTPNGTLRYEATDSALKTSVGILQNQVLVTTSRPGHLLYGPFIDIGPGTYRVGISGKRSSAGVATMDICAKFGTLVLLEKELAMQNFSELILNETFVVPKGGANNLEVRIVVDSDVNMELVAIEIEKIE
jgi:glycosyltransferase involved in cell wall biosynthesis